MGIKTHSVHQKCVKTRIHHSRILKINPRTPSPQTWPRRGGADLTWGGEEKETGRKGKGIGRGASNKRESGEGREGKGNKGRVLSGSRDGFFMRWWLFEGRGERACG